MSIAEIERAIPHRAPMRLIDEIVEQDASSIICRKTFAADEFFVQGHFPNDPIVPGVIQCECCLQTGAVLLCGSLEGATDALPVATRMDGVKFKRIVRPGDTIDVHVKLKERLANAYFMTGKVMLAGKLAMRLEFACSLTSVDSAAARPQP